MSVLRKIASNTLSQVTAKFIAAALSVIIVKLISTKIGTSGYGEYTLIYEFLAIFLIIADFGFFTIAVKEMAADQKRLPQILGNVLSIRLILMAILSFIAIGIVYATSYSPTIKLGVVIAAIGMSFNLISITVSTALQAKLKMNWNSLAVIIGKSTMLAYIYYTIKYIPAKDSLFHFLLAGLYGNIVMLLITAIATWCITPIRLYFNMSIWKDLIKKTFIYGLSLITLTLYTRAITLILNYHHSTTEVGIYQAPFRVYEILILIPVILLNCILPIIMVNLKNKKQLARITQNTFDALIIIGLGIIAGTLTLAKPVILLFFSEQFIGSVIVLKLLSIATVFGGIYVLYSYILLALKKEKQLLYINLATLALTIPVAWLVIKPYAEIGAAATIIFSQVLIAFASMYIARPKLSYRIINTATASAIIMGGYIYLVNDKVNIIFTFFSAIIIYALALYFSRSFSSEITNLIPLPKLTPKPKLAFRPKINRQRKSIAIDARVTIGQKAGKGWYVYNVLSELGKLDSSHNYYLYARHDFFLPPDMPANFHKRIISSPLIIWHILAYLDMRFILRINTIFAPASYIIPALSLGSKIKIIPVIHDLVSVLYPKDHNRKARIIETFTLKLTLRKASKIIAVSESTKDDLIKYFPRTKDKIVVIPEAARQNYQVLADSEIRQQILKKHGIPKNYILFIGTLEPRKNLTTLIKAFALFNKREQEDKFAINNFASSKLVIVGKKGWSYKSIFQQVRKLKLQDKVIFTDYIDDSELPHILSGAQVFVYPSKYEGFGLPLLEAYACGIPVIASNTKALAEVAGNSSILVDPNDHIEIAEKMRLLLRVQKLQKDIVTRQHRRLAKYSWTSTTKQILAIIK